MGFYCAGQTTAPVVPLEFAVGDILLDPGEGASLVTVYLPQSPGTQQQSRQFGEICMNGISDYRSVGTVICRQLGYTSGKLVPPSALLK